MTDLTVHIGDKGDVRVIHVPVDPEETLENLARRIATEGYVDGHGVLEMVLDQLDFDAAARCGNLTLKNHHVQVRRVCVQVQFETESEQHWFPSQTRWSRVHQWACKYFNVAPDACGNLELRAGAPEGAPINERERIGDSEECRVVWLVKPGPEQNG